jgi:uncharacterized protein (TIGR02569 family)
VTPRPSNEVLRAFGADGDPIPLDGGEGLSFRAGRVVLKRVHGVAEADWTQSLLSRVEPDGFRIPEPIAAGADEWVHEDWIASAFIDGLQPAAPAWRDIVDAGLRFSDAAEQARAGGGIDVLSQRTHRWAVADRVAWGEASVALDDAAMVVHAEITRLFGGQPRGEHFVHGDLSGNVFVDRAGTPVILDVSPYLRPREWAAAIVIADAVLWNGADVALAVTFARDELHRDLFGRALLFRLVAEQLADDPRHGAFLEPYDAVLRAVR